MPTETELLIRIDDLSDPRIAAFMEEHLQDMRATSPPESVHALDMSKLRQPEIAFWTAWLSDSSGAPGEMLAATAAIKRLDAAHAELKSMRTAAVLRGRGLARRMLRHVLAEARQRGYRRLSLETGTQAFFEPARQLYASEGFCRLRAFRQLSARPAQLLHDAGTDMSVAAPVLLQVARLIPQGQGLGAGAAAPCGQPQPGLGHAAEEPLSGRGLQRPGLGRVPAARHPAARRRCLAGRGWQP